MTRKPFYLISNWLEKDNANNLCNNLKNKLEWEQPMIKLYGKKHLVPRLVSFISNKGISYSYSGIIHIGKGWPDCLIPLLNQVREYCKVDFNGCLLNLYRDGEDSMGWHADNEKELDLNMNIASLSLGERRDFYFKNIASLEKVHFTLGNGDLLIMEPNCQTNWLHSLPKRKKITGFRINLTFRKYLFN